MLLKTLILLSAAAAPFIVAAQQTPSIIPQPVELKMKDGIFMIDRQTVIHYAKSETEVQPAAQFFTAAVQHISGITVPLNKAGKKIIDLVVDKSISSNSEAYQLTVTPSSVLIKATGYGGIIYGLQSILQTLPQVRSNAALSVPCMEIKDEPRFKWRGMHLDVSRHFFSPEVIKEYIDLLAFYKMNTFHWHLVDDQGWRIEIKKYPKLTQTGAWRVDHTDRVWGSRPQAQPGEAATYGGYYTQEQLKEIVAYASVRNINIVPEIEMPGHVASAIASYPDLSCAQKPQLPLTGGNYNNMASNYCAGDEKVFTFLQDVLTEVMAIFPSTYIHVGGDEVDKDPWKKCPKCQKRIKDEHLKNEEELQSYFIKRIENFIISKNRKLIGWDEILEGGLAPEATVMSWRGETGGIEAAKMEHNVVMTPGSPCYFDHYQAGPEGEPLAIGGFNTVKKVYEYEPIPKELTGDKAKYVLGAQGNVWTEFISTRAHLEYMVLPRMLALAETVWTPAATKNWIDFSRRLKVHFAAFDQKGLHYSPGNYTVDVKPVSENGKLKVALYCDVPAAEVRYTTDGSVPTLSSEKYAAPIAVDHPQTIRAIALLNDKVMTLQPVQQSFVLHKAVGSNVTYQFAPSGSYMADGINSLTDGVKGKAATGKFWHGFNGNNLVATVDMGEAKTISRISISCMQNSRSWIFLPTAVKFETSVDGITYTEAGTVKNDIATSVTELIMKDFAVTVSTAAVRYIRVTAYTLTACPKGHPGEGRPAWTFADEIIVD